MTITPEVLRPASGQIVEATPDLRNGVGAIIDGRRRRDTPSQPLTASTSAPSLLTVNISGVTVDGDGVYAEAGILFRDAQGSISRSRVTNIVTTETSLRRTPRPASTTRRRSRGIGIAHDHQRALRAGADGAAPSSRIERTRVDKYNKIGVLIDGATNDYAAALAVGHDRAGASSSPEPDRRPHAVRQLRGHRQLLADGTGTPGGPPPSTGPLYGQDGVRVTAGSYATVDELARSRRTSCRARARRSQRHDDQQRRTLTLGAGVRSSAQADDYRPRRAGRLLAHLDSNIIDNAYGVFNVQLDGTTAPRQRQREPDAEPGQLAPRTTGGACTTAARPTNPGPAISPTTQPERAGEPGQRRPRRPSRHGRTTSNAVDFFPYPQRLPVATRTRASSRSSTRRGPVNDAAPTVGLTAPATAKPGDTITLTAAPADDFGVKRVRFYDGSTTIGTVPTAAVRAARTRSRRRDLRQHAHVHRGRDGLGRPDRLASSRRRSTR